MVSTYIELIAMDMQVFPYLSDVFYCPLKIFLNLIKKSQELSILLFN